VALVGALLALAAGRLWSQEPPGREAAEETKKLVGRLGAIFEKSPEKRLPLEELKISEPLKEGLDLNRDGVVDRTEAELFIERQRNPSRYAGPRDRSDFTHLEEEGFPLNLNPENVPAGEAPIADSDLVLGILLNGEARAYPVNYMNGPTNEVVNDVLGGEAIAPSW
jgi:hypothetical protein